MSNTYFKSIFKERPVTYASEIIICKNIDSEYYNCWTCKLQNLLIDLSEIVDQWDQLKPNLYQYINESNEKCIKHEI